MKTEPTAPTPAEDLAALPEGFDADAWRERLSEAANAYLFKRAAYQALPKTPAEVLERLPTGANAYEALSAAGSALYPAYREANGAAEALQAVVYELFKAAPVGNPSLLSNYERAFTEAAVRAQKEAAEADRRAAELSTVTARHAAADVLETKRREYEAAMREARAAGVPV